MRLYTYYPLSKNNKTKQNKKQKTKNKTKNPTGEKLSFYCCYYRFQKILSRHKTIIFKRSYLLWLITYFQMIRETNYFSVSHLCSNTRCLKCIWALISQKEITSNFPSFPLMCSIFYYSFTISKMVMNI